MVSILPPKTNAGAMIGQSLGQGLGAGIQKGSEIGFQRNLLQNALGDLGNIPSDATPFDIASKLIKATAGIPGSERYVGQLYPLLLEAQKSQALASPETATALSGLNNRPNAFQPSQPQQQVSINQSGPPELTFVKNVLGDKYFPDVQEPENLSPEEGFKPIKPPGAPKPIGPIEESKIRSALMKQGIKNPYVIDDLIKKSKDYQTELYEAQKEGFKNAEQYQAARKLEDDRFFSQVAPAIEAQHGPLTPQRLSIWRGLSRLPENSGPDENRYANTETMFNNLVEGPHQEFDSIGPRLPYGSVLQRKQVAENLEDARSIAQDQLKRIDEREYIPEPLKSQIKANLRDSFMTSMASKDWGVAQAAYAISNLSPESSTKIPHAPPPKETAYDTVYLSDPKVRETKVSELANALTNIKKDDSLILLREKALKNNYDDRAFNEALRKAIGSGKLVLSDYQNLERSRLTVPQRLDLNSIMEGKRSVFDLFKAKQ